jgi:predicted O-methyltransferase YrrM
MATIKVHLDKYMLLSYWLFRHPYWAWGTIHSSNMFPGNSRKINASKLAEYFDYILPLEEALPKMQIQDSLQLSKEVYEVRHEIALETTASHFIPSKIDASDELAMLCYVAVRAIKPFTVVETGVARGVTTYYVLRAMEKNGQGHLFSIDLPWLKKNAEKEIGVLVPLSLRSRWTLSLGWSIHELKKLQKKVNKIDLFIHDSDHSYLNQRHEYDIALNWLADHGLLISDDVGNSSLLECYRKYGGTLSVVPQKWGGYIGLIRLN